MKKCPVCDRDYDATADACPHCAALAFVKKAKAVVTIVVGMAVIVFVIPWWLANGASLLR